MAPSVLTPLETEMPTDSERADPQGRHATSAWRLLSVVVGTAAAGISLGPIKDHDVFLHLAVGEQILTHGRSVTPDTWAYTQPGKAWSTSSWAADVGLALTHRVSGDRGIVLLELAGTVALLVSLHLLLRRHRPGTQAAVFTLACVSLWPFFEERPQLASLIFLVWLSSLCHRLRTGQAEFNPPVVLAVTWLWTCVHGMWVLVPVALVLVLIAVQLDGVRFSSRLVGRVLITAVLAPVVAALTPVGPRLLLAPFTVASAAHGRIAEWLPAKLDRPFAWGFVALFVLTVVAWALGRERPARSEVIWVLAVAAYAGIAWRNLGPACILIAPVSAAALDRCWQRQNAPRVSTKVTLAIAGVATLLLVLAAVRMPTAPPWAPSRIATALQAQHTSVNVLNDYDLGGYLATSSGPDVRVAVDGRAERYGGPFLDRYFAMIQGRPGWRSTFDGLDPDAAVLAVDAPLVEHLSEAGWRTIVRDRGYLLLVPPGSQLTSR